MGERPDETQVVNFEFRPGYARWRVPLVLAFLAVAVASAVDFSKVVAVHRSFGALLSSGDRSDAIWFLVGITTLLGVGVWLWVGLGKRFRLSIDGDSFRWAGPQPFVVPLGTIRRLAVFGDDISLATYTIETRTGETRQFLIYSPRLRQEIRPFLDEVERRTGLEWIGVSEADTPAGQRGFLEALRDSAGIGSRRDLVRWFLERAVLVRVGELGLNDKLVRTGFSILGGRAVWAIAVLIASEFLIVLWPLRLPVQVGLVLVVLVSTVAIGIHTSLGMNVILTLVQGEVRRRERLEQELDTARSVQDRLAPQAPPRVPGFEIAGTCIPAREVGGDYYDYIPAADGGTVVAVADVSGKGLGPGLLMTLTKGALVSSLRGAPSLEAALGQVNGTLRAAVQKHMFVSMALAKLSSGKGSVTIARAGHNPPLVVRRDGRSEWIRPSGVALGLASGAVFEKACGVEEVSLEPGDTLVLYTDGVTEAMNASAEEFGDERLAAAVGTARSVDAQSIRDSVLADVAAFRDGAQVMDDQTLVVVKATG